MRNPTQNLFFPVIVIVIVVQTMISLEILSFLHGWCGRALSYWTRITCLCCLYYFFFLWKSLTWKKRPLLTIILFNFFFLLCLFVCLSFSVFFFSVLLFTNFTLLLAYCPIYRSNVVVVVGKFNWDFFFFRM